MKLNGRTILITGGTSGIGFELARELLARGNQVIVTGREKTKLVAAAAELPGLQTLQSDVSDPAAIIALYGEVIARYPALDTLINNAGIMRNLDLNQPRELADVTRELDINLAGPVRMVQQFLPHLKTRADALIVNVSSGLAFVPFPLSPVYSAAKAGIHAYSRILRLQLRASNVSVVELAPPGVDTPLFHKEFPQLKDQKTMKPAVLARKAIAGIESGKFEIRPGQSNLLKIFSRLAPGFALNMLSKAATPKP